MKNNSNIRRKKNIKEKSKSSLCNNFSFYLFIVGGIERKEKPTHELCLGDSHT
jgi:hypothetical protein